MTYDPEKHHRRSIRLKNYDYAQAGAYFVTICVHQREMLLGTINDDEMHLNECGKIVQDCWDNLPEHYPQIELDMFVIMPNHVHAIIVLPTKAAKPLSEILRGFKTLSARKINEQRQSPGIPVWQRNYYEQIIRHEIALNNIRQYIEQNPSKWADDKYNDTRTHS